MCDPELCERAVPFQRRLLKVKITEFWENIKSYISKFFKLQVERWEETSGVEHKPLYYWWYSDTIKTQDFQTIYKYNILNNQWSGICFVGSTSIQAKKWNSLQLSKIYSHMMPEDLTKPSENLKNRKNGVGHNTDLVRLVEAVTRHKLRSFGKPLDYTSHVLSLMLCKSKLSFTWFPSAITRKYSCTIWRSSSDGVHFEHSSTKGIPNGYIKHPMVG